MAWRISLHPLLHMTNFSSISQKKNKSLQLTIALYYLPIVWQQNIIWFLFMHGHKTRKCCKMLYVVWDIPERNRPYSNFCPWAVQAISEATFDHQVTTPIPPCGCKTVHPHASLKCSLGWDYPRDYPNLGDYPNPFRSSWPSWLTGEAPVRGTRRTSRHHPWSGRCPGGSWSPWHDTEIGRKKQICKLLNKVRI